MVDPDDGARRPTAPGSDSCERACAPEDWRLAQDVLQGSLPAWHEFVVRYTRLIRSVLQRQLYTADADELRAVYVDVLAHLQRGAFGSFQGRCSLGTWVALVARARAMDYLRGRFGRHELPAGHESLTSEDREVFRLYYQEGLGLAQVQERLALARRGRGNGARARRGAAGELHHIVAALQRIEAAIGPRVLQRYTDQAAARSVGIAAARLLRYLDHARREALEQQQVHTPEALVLQREVDEARRMVRQLVQRLPREDRLAVRLWFFRDCDAEELSRAIGLPNRRKAYTVVQRGLRRLRRLMLAAGYDPGERVMEHRPAVAREDLGGH